MVIERVASFLYCCLIKDFSESKKKLRESYNNKKRNENCLKQFLIGTFTEFKKNSLQFSTEIRARLCISFYLAKVI